MIKMKNFGLLGWIFSVGVLLLLVSGVFCDFTDGLTYETDDAIIVEAANLRQPRSTPIEPLTNDLLATDDELLSRDKRHVVDKPSLEEEHVDRLIRQKRQFGGWPGVLPIGPCFTSKGIFGHCTSFRKCYPYFKLPELSNWETWILGMYDTCSYFTTSGRQMFGVCCSNPGNPRPPHTIPLPPAQPLPPPPPPVVAPVEPVPIIAPVEPSPIVAEKPIKIPQNPGNPVPPNWPPPLPTHPPDHTIPPLPTHPPSPSWPGQPPVVTPAPSPPVVQPVQPPPQPPPAWPPAPPPAQPPPSWPPAQPPPSWPPAPGQPWPPPSWPPGQPPAPVKPPTQPVQPGWPPAKPPTQPSPPSWPPAKPPTQPSPPSWPPVQPPAPVQPIQPWPPAFITHPPIAKPPVTSRPPPIAPVQPVPPGPDAGGGAVIGDAGSCGAKNGFPDQERIVGGQNADLGEWPWIAALFNGARQFCGGSLIDSTHILTAAHCVAHMSSWDVARLTVKLGDHNIKTNTEVRHVEKKVARVVRHRGFDSRTLYNDIAILTMDSPVTFTKAIKPICLPTGSALYNGQTATVIGWGSLRESGPQPAVLQEVNIPIWTNAECKAKYGNAAPGGIVEHFLCAGQAGRDSCSGDSGGPLTINNGRWTQVGVVSWGIGCGKGQYPGVYTRVTHFMSWISKNLK